MPMHDWTKLDPNDYHDFHYSWIAAIKSALNDGILPAGYFAMADHTTPPVIPDVVTLSLPDEFPPSSSHQNGMNGSSKSVAVAPFKSTITATAPGKARRAAGRWRVAIRHARNRHIVAVIEIVSPSNKSRKPDFADLIGKTVQLLRQGIHVLLIDPFPPTARDPEGIHAIVWKELTGKLSRPSQQKPLTVASYVALGGSTFTAHVEPLEVGDKLPEMPLFLTDEEYVEVPLERTYQLTWQGFPAPLRRLVEAL